MVLICNKQQLYANIVLDGIFFDTDQIFTYLGSKITNYGKSHTDTVYRIIKKIWVVECSSIWNRDLDNTDQER